MKVTSHDLSSLGATGASGTQETQKRSTSGAYGSGGANGSDHVSFSSTLGSLGRAMNTESSNRESRVQSLAAQFQSGSLSFSSADISSGMISEALG
ncbi:MAG TPA: flagellar biosynthesis anti-sigma factor FlgM [Bryobacteraceae bacterium]|jgi:anti-sigma28 factor (negative regulator of flagellin synthesis)|nr:flagellar biosynthesis anti-sigma factor FlgM [Bryobacteraceae bacterium]